MRKMSEDALRAKEDYRQKYMEIEKAFAPTMEELTAANKSLEEADEILEEIQGKVDQAESSKTAADQVRPVN